MKVDILLQGEAVDAFSAIVHADAGLLHLRQQDGPQTQGNSSRASGSRQPIQAAIGSKIIARENIRLSGKDVLAKCWR